VVTVEGSTSILSNGQSCDAAYSRYSRKVIGSCAKIVGRTRCDVQDAPRSQPSQEQLLGVCQRQTAQCLGVDVGSVNEQQALDHVPSPDANALTVRMGSIVKRIIYHCRDDFIRRDMDS
jgi:hypothetical protein